MNSLIILAISGKNDLFLIDNPTITFFKKIYKKKTNFLLDTFNQEFKQDFDFGKKISCELSRNGDLLIDVMLHVKISGINNYIDPITKVKNKFVRFAWARKLGFALINKMELEIGGVIIQSLYSDWLNIWYELTESEHKKTIDEMIGNIEENYKFSETKKNVELYVPLPFWFKNNNLALPMFLIKYHNINLHLHLNNKSNICNIGPNRSIEINENFVYFKEYEIIQQSLNNKKNIGIFINFDINTKTLYYINLKNEFIIPNNNDELINYKITGIESNFELIPKSTSKNNFPKLLNYNFDINIEKINVLTTYAYLELEDKIQIEKLNNLYLINLIQSNLFNIKVNKNLNVKLNFFNNCRELIWISKLKYIKNFDFFNYTDNLIERKVINNKSTISLDEIKLNKFNKYQYFNYLIPNYYHENIPDLGINCYNFCLNCESIQPNGAVNLSKFNNIHLDLKYENLINEDIELLVFNNYYNFLKIENGIVSLLFND